MSQRQYSSVFLNLFTKIVCYFMEIFLFPLRFILTIFLQRYLWKSISALRWKIWKRKLSQRLDVLLICFGYVDFYWCSIAIDVMFLVRLGSYSEEDFRGSTTEIITDNDLTIWYKGQTGSMWQGGEKNVHMYAKVCLKFLMSSIWDTQPFSIIIKSFTNAYVRMGRWVIIF